jgi:hypothetical protein
MGKRSQNHCTQVVSFRITEKERRFLGQLALKSGKSVSETMRELLCQVDDSIDGPLHQT